ncbi:hypothetical protein RND81_10G204000 [Saponaria officinalis]|uniref:No apical meristem-associated C-terminal domain-containing protein n=1 Tax=Saponaria officinalis TaxID=3572 RepID=A0AAW1I585_SAPOF
MSRNTNFHFNYDDFDLNTSDDQNTVIEVDNTNFPNSSTQQNNRPRYHQQSYSTPPFQSRPTNIDFRSANALLRPSNPTFSNYLTHTPLTSQNSPISNLSPESGDIFPVFSTQTNPTFLNFNVTGDTDVDGDEDNPNQNPLDVSDEISSRANFSIEEDQALIASYMKVSEDSIVGSRQKIDKMWARVKEQYDLARSANSKLRARKEGMLDNRFRRIATIVMRWAGCYHKASARRMSYRKWMVTIGPYASAASKVGVVIESSPDVDSNSSGKRVRLEDGNYSSPISIESHTDSIQRLEGREAAKRRKGKKKVNAEYEEMNKNFQRLEQLSNRDQELDMEKLEIKKKNAEVALQQIELKNV